MNISYCVTVCNEEIEFKKLIKFLIDNIRDTDEICILIDEPKCPSSLKETIQDLSPLPNIKIKFDKFENHFANWKNKMFELAEKDYLMFIDADEMITKDIIEDVPHILDIYNLDVLGIARENLVEGITQEYIDQWRWNVDEQNRINFPDVQIRYFANKPNIRWQNKVHETPSGYSTISILPAEEYHLIHHKKLEKQIKQNNYYNTL